MGRTPWIQPFTDEVLPLLAARGAKRLVLDKVGVTPGGSDHWQATLSIKPASLENSDAGSWPVLYTVLFGTCLPITAIMVPVYSLFVQLNLLDSLMATTFFLAATSLPMAIWMTKNFMDSVPVSLEEAAWVDGASGMKALWHIVVPLMRPGLGVVFIFVFIQAWGNFFVPFILLFSQENQPAAVSIFRFFGQFGTVAYGQLAAFSILYALPVIVLYVLVSRVFGGSFAMSGALSAFAAPHVPEAYRGYLPLAATFAIIAIWETTRECRWINLALGIWQLLAPWVLPLFGGAYPADATFNRMVCGAVLAACSLVRGEVRGQYGGGWRVLWRGDPRVQPDQR